MFQIECEVCHATEWVPGTYSGDEAMLDDADADACEHLAEGGEFAIIDEEAEFEE